MMILVNYLRVRLANKKGQGMVEYGLILGGIAVAAVAAVLLFKGAFTDMFTDLVNYIKGINPVGA